MSTGMILDGILGSEAIDSTGEVLDVKGADISDVDKGTLLLNWEHLPGEKGASTIVGIVLAAKKIYQRSDCENDRQRMYWDDVKLPFIYGVARLYDGAGHEEAKRIAAIIRDHVANNEPIVCRYSVEGATLKKEDNRLKESLVRRVAITIKPANRTAVSGLIEDPNAPDGFEKKHVKQKVRDLLDFSDTNKSEFVDPLFQQLGHASDIVCNPMVEEGLAKTYTAGTASAAPGSLVGGAALQREDLDKSPHSIAQQAKDALDNYGERPFNRKEFREFAKSLLPEASDDFLDHFADMAEDYHVKRSSLAKKESTAVPKQPKAAPKQKQVSTPKQPKVAPAKAKSASPSFLDEEDSSPVKINVGTIRGVPVMPTKVKGGIQFDEANGVLHTTKGSFPLYNPDKGFQMKEGKSGSPHYEDGVLHVKKGTDVSGIHNGPNPGFRDVYNSEPIEEFHSGKVMPNWVRVHQLAKAGRTPEEVVMHAAVFSMLSPNTPVRPHELMHAHMVDTWEDLGIDPRDPDFKKAKRHWMRKDKPQNYPRTAGDYFRSHVDVHLSGDSEDAGRKAGDLKSFMLANNKFANISKYHDLHHTLMDLVRRHGTDSRAATAELMGHKAKETSWKNQRRAFRSKLKDKLRAAGLTDDVTSYVKSKMAAMAKPGEREPGADDDDETPMAWNPALLPTASDAGYGRSSMYYSARRSPRAVAKDRYTQEAMDQGLKDQLSETAEAQTRAHPQFGAYRGVEVPGLAPKTGRFAFTMLGGGNSFVPDTHIVRHLFGMDGAKDGKTLAYLKSSLWNAKNHHILEGIDRWYAKNHPAAQLMQKHPKWGPEFKDDPEQANFPAFWRHWCSIAQDERNRGMDGGAAQNEFSTHEPFWLGIDKFVKGEEQFQHHMVSKTVAFHHKYAQDYGEVPAQMMFFAHMVPHLIEASQYRQDHDDLSDFAKSMPRIHALDMELRKSAGDIRAAEFADPTTPIVHAMYYRDKGREGRAGRFMTHQGQLHHLEDYYGLLDKFIQEGPVTMNTISKLHGLKMSPHLRFAIEEAKKPDQPKVEHPQAIRERAKYPDPPSVFEYHRAGHDKPHTLEVRDKQYMLDGQKLTHPEVQTILDNWHSGAATLRYKSQQGVDVRKAEIVFESLMKDESSGGFSEEDLLRHSQAAEDAGYLPKGHTAAQRSFYFEDPMTPGMGNKKAWQSFQAKNKPGTYVQMDGNDFRDINNNFGHEAGDAAIRGFGNSAREAMDETVGKENGKLFRNGGDEFIAHVPSQEHAALFSRKLSEKLQKLAPIGGVHQPSMSFGFGHDARTADAALYEAKKQKLHPQTGQRLYKVGQVPNLAHSLVPGNEGAIPIHDRHLEAVHANTEVNPPEAAAPTAPAAA
jgi:GGDEF domain-containing protein